MTFRGPVPLASTLPPLARLADNDGAACRAAVDRSPEASGAGGLYDATRPDHPASSASLQRGSRRDTAPETFRGPNRENRYLAGLLAVRGLPFDTTYLQARIVAGYRKGGT